MVTHTINGFRRIPARVCPNLAGAFFVALLVSLPAHAEPARAIVQTRSQRTPLLIAEPEARVSAAARAGDDLAGKHGVVPAPQPGYTVYARVVARLAPGPVHPNTLTAESLRANPRVLGVRYAPSVRGCLLIECGSITEALRLADELSNDPRFAAAELDVQRPRATRSLPTDPAFAEQWFLHNTLQPEIDLNVTPAWDMGITGEGVTVGIVEGGWQTNHPDLAANYDADASMPGGSSTSHSTSCAGLVAAAADNGMGGVGVAYGARVSNLIYGGPASATADALAFRDDLNAVKSNSWGPPDLGTLASISSIELAALEQSASSGRGGLGTVFTWAAGNGGADDRVDYDPFASSRHTIAVGAIGDQGVAADFNEPGSSLFVVTPSSGNMRDVFTTANGSGYNPGFGGTSAACPMAAGVVALMLQANPGLSGRDVRHILARTARKCDPSDPEWSVNGGGHAMNPKYGFGAIDAHAAVLLARAWTPAAPEIAADSGTITVETPIPDNNPAGVTRTITIGDAITVEHAELILDVSTNYVGDLRITLKSPSGTVSVLAEPRDDPQDDLVGRVFTSVRHWDEPGTGVWTVTIADRGPLDLATWHAFRVVLYGTPTPAPGCSRADLAAPFGRLNFFDVAAFVAEFNAQGAAADLDGNGLWNFFDVSAFVTTYNAGCP